MATNDEKQKLFEKAIGNVNANLMKKRGAEDSVISIFGDKQTSVPTISTGSIVLDSLLGGGFPKGRIIEIFGPEASGKTSIALTAAGNVQAEGGTVAFVDLEHALDPRYAKKLGVDVKDMAVAQPADAQQALDLCMNLADTGTVDMIILDSIAALVPREVLEGSMDDQQMGLVARLLSKALAPLAGKASKNNCTVVLINQTREKIGVMFGNPETTSGGQATKFYASQRIRVSKIGKPKLDENKQPVGNTVKFKIIKNKIAPPYREGETVLTFNKGINVASELVEIGPDIGAIEKPSTRAWVNPATGEKFAGSKDEAVKALETNVELFNSIADQVYAFFDEDDFDETNVDTETGEILESEEESN